MSLADDDEFLALWGAASMQTSPALSAWASGRDYARQLTRADKNVCDLLDRSMLRKGTYDTAIDSEIRDLAAVLRHIKKSAPDGGLPFLNETTQARSVRAMQAGLPSLGKR